MHQLSTVYRVIGGAVSWADMRPLALFDLDDTLTDRREAFRAWAEEFAAA